MVIFKILGRQQQISNILMFTMLYMIYMNATCFALVQWSLKLWFRDHLLSLVLFFMVPESLVKTREETAE